jgi:hypothetical protein
MPTTLTVVCGGVFYTSLQLQLVAVNVVVRARVDAVVVVATIRHQVVGLDPDSSAPVVLAAVTAEFIAVHRVINPG